MMNWKFIQSTQDVLEIADRSHQVPCLIFKHSTSCPISSMAKLRLEEDWDFPHHESPQVILIRNGICTYDNSHLDINVAEIHECYDAAA